VQISILVFSCQKEVVEDCCIVSTKLCCV